MSKLKIDWSKAEIKLPGGDLPCPKIEFEKPSLHRLMDSFLFQGFSVCYVDADKMRRVAAMNWAKAAWPDSRLMILAPKVSGQSMMHFNVLITVNEQDFDPILRKEIRCIPGVCGGKGICVVKVEM